jgi:histidine phosphotransferase ChpT
MASPMQLAELVCARFSHDLSGLLGSLHGLLELAAETPGRPVEEVVLAARTARELTLRLRLLRAAWGGVLDPIGADALREQMPGIAGSHRLQLDLDGLAEGVVFPPPMARLILNIVLLAGEATPRGGVLTISGDPNTLVVAQIAGPDAAWPVGFARYLANEAQAWNSLGDPRELQAPLTALIARAMGIRLSLMMATGSLADVSPPPLMIAPEPT